MLMRREIGHLEVKFILGFITVIVGFMGASIALFRWVERTGVQHLFGEYSRYVLGFGGFAAMIFGAILINDAWVLRDVSKGKYKLPKSYTTTTTAAVYEEISDKLGTARHPVGYKQSFIKSILKMHGFNEESKLARFLKKLGRRRK